MKAREILRRPARLPGSKAFFASAVSLQCDGQDCDAYRGLRSWHLRSIAIILPWAIQISGGTLLKTILAITLIGLLGSPVAAQDKPQAYVGAHLIPISGLEIDNGVLVVQGGKILSAGAAADVQVPDGAEKHDLAGKVIM